MMNQMRTYGWVLVLLLWGVGCLDADMQAQSVDAGVFETDAGVAQDVAQTMIRDGAVDLREQARGEGEGSPNADADMVALEAVAQAKAAAQADTTAPAAPGDLPALSGKPMMIYSVDLEEVEQGFQLSIPCTDDSVPTRIYDREIRKNRSERCQIDETSARASFVFEPAISYQVATTPQGLLVSADFERRNYTLKIKAGLRTRDGGALEKDFDTTFSVGKLSSNLGFITKGRYMPRAAWQDVSLRHRNLEASELEVWHVPGRNMAFWMSGHNEIADPRSADLVYAQQLQLEDTVDQQFTTELPMQKLLGAPKPGLYELRIKSGKSADTLRVVVTDMQLIAKRSNEDHAEQVDVWALHARTLQPLHGATVQAVLTSGTVVAECKTNLAGYCRVRAKTGDAEDKVDNIQARTPFALVVTHKDDATYLKYSELETKLARGKTHGAPYRNMSAYQAFIYADRDLYRPADIVHIAAMVRDIDLASVGAGVPVDLVVVDSRAQIVARKTQETNAGGMVTLNHRLGDMAITGHWRVRVEIGKREVTSFKFSVEEFMPERLAVEASTRQEHLGPKDNFKVDVHARYLFGASAMGSKLTMRCERMQAAFAPAKHANYQYGPLLTGELDADNDRETRQVTQAMATVIDADDKAQTECDFQTSMASTMRLRAEVSVSESGSGRITHASASTWAHPESYYIGVRSNLAEIVRGKPVTLQGVVVDWAGELRNDVTSVEVSVIQLRRRWGYWHYYNRHRSQWIQVVERSERIPVRDGQFIYQFTPRSDAYHYAIRLKSGDARTDLKIPRAGYSWRWNYRSGSQTPRPADANALILESAGEIGVSEAHKVRFVSEFKGRALMTVETDEVLQSAWVDVEPGEVEWSFEVDAFAPNIYVSAMLLKDPHTESATSFLPERAFGALSIPMKREKFSQSIKMNAPESVRPGHPLTVDLDLGKDAAGGYITVAAVDQGILSLTDYMSPDPLDSLLARRALGVRTYDTIGWALQLAKLNATSKTGGGDDEESAPELSRIMPFKPVALWSGLKKVPKSGKLSVTFDVPLYQGELRVMAVAAAKTRMGHVEQRVKVRDPIVVQATLPRFLIAGDQVDIPVFLSNTTATTQVIDASISAEELAEPGLARNPNPADIIGIVGDKTQQVTVKPGQSATVLFKARALRSAGAATFVVSASATSASGEILKSRAEAVVPFRAAGPLERKVKTLLVSTKSVDLGPLLDGWEPASEKTTFRLSTNPHAGAFEHLSSLVRYPYGCLEQTISKLRPMIYLSELVRSVDPGFVAGKKSIRPMIEGGVSRILSMQTPSGGFGFWSGSSTPHRWGTPYALYLLMDAQKRGYSVPQERIDRALNWLVSDVKRQQTQGYGRSDYYSERYVSGFSHYVLALANRANQAEIRKLIDATPADVKGEQFESLYLMKAALYLSGDRSFEDELKAFELDASDKRVVNYQSYYSTRRRNALLLNIFIDLFGAHENALKTVDRLGRTFAQTQTTGYRYSTQEMGWGLTALGKWFARNPEHPFSAQLLAEGRTVKPTHSDEQTSATNWGMVRASEYASMTLELDKTPEKPLYLVVSSEGVRTEPNVTFGGEGLSVEREYLNQNGDAIDGKVELGELIFVRIRLKSTTGRSLQNIALVDRLPAGLEIENPELRGEVQPSWVAERNVWRTDNINVRDDRLEAFGSIGSGQTVELVYTTRATLTGKFHAPSVEAEGMYDPEIWARAAYRKLEVTHNWHAMID